VYNNKYRDYRPLKADKHKGGKIKFYIKEGGKLGAFVDRRLGGSRSVALGTGVNRCIVGIKE
jgi:hypothetical protein